VNGTVASAAPDHWMQRGFDLKTIVAMVSATDPSRVELPESFDSQARYDFVLVPPSGQDIETMHRQVREGIEKYFQVTITPELLSRDVYVMTALDGKHPEPKPEGREFGSSIATSAGYSVEVALHDGVQPTEEVLKLIDEQRRKIHELYPAIGITSISAHNSSMEYFRKALEAGLNRPILDETKLTGSYDLEMQGEARTTEEFLAMLRDQFGLLLTSARRSIDMVVVRKAFSN
jgi:uncharacterized protein (TIGR03435 family)